MKPKFAAFAATRRFSLHRRSIWEITEQCPSSFYLANPIFREKEREREREREREKKQTDQFFRPTLAIRSYKLSEQSSFKHPSLDASSPRRSPNSPDYTGKRSRSGARRIKRRLETERSFSTSRWDHPLRVFSKPVAKSV